MTTERTPACNTGLAKVAVQFSASTFVVKIATFAKPENVICHLKEDTIDIEQQNIENYSADHFRDLVCLQIISDCSRRLFP